MTIDEAAIKLIQDMKDMEAAIPNDAEYGKAMRVIVRQMKEIDQYLDDRNEKD